MVISAEVPLDQLFCSKRENKELTDDERKLMDDLNITPVSDKANVQRYFTQIIMCFCRRMQRQMFSPGKKKLLPLIVPFHV